LRDVMSGAIDVGYSVPPFAVAELGDGKVRIVARASDLPALAQQTVRFIIANAEALARGDVLRRFLQGYRETVEWMFSDDREAISAFARWAGVPGIVARRTRDEFLRRENMLPDRISGLATIA